MRHPSVAQPDRPRRKCARRNNLYSRSNVRDWLGLRNWLISLRYWVGLASDIDSSDLNKSSADWAGETMWSTSAKHSPRAWTMSADYSSIGNSSIFCFPTFSALSSCSSTEADYPTDSAILGSETAAASKWSSLKHESAMTELNITDLTTPKAPTISPQTFPVTFGNVSLIILPFQKFPLSKLSNWNILGGLSAMSDQGRVLKSKRSKFVRTSAQWNLKYEDSE